MGKTVPGVYRRARAQSAAAIRSSGPLVPLMGGGVTEAGVYVTPETALTYSAVFAAVSIISTDAAMLPTAIYERLPEGGSRPATPDLLPDTLRDLLQVEPNPEVDALHALGSWFGDALCRGNGYLEIVRSKIDGRPLRLWRIDPRDCQPARSTSGRLVYDLSNGKSLRPEDVLHLKGYSQDGITGQSVVQLARQTIGLGSAAELTTAGMFGRGPNVSGFIKSKRKLSPEAQKEMREFFMGEYGGPWQAGKVANLVGDMEWVQANLSPSDGQFLASRAFNVIEVCRWFNLSPVKLKDYSNGRYNSIEQAEDEHYGTTILPWASWAEAEFNRKLLTPADRRRWFIRHDFDARLRGDSTTRWNNYQKGFGMGVLSQNEIRRAENMEPIPGGDVHYFPSNNFTPIADATTASVPALAGPTRSARPDPIRDPADYTRSSADPIAAALADLTGVLD